jgi:hypothetical protein
MRMIIALGLLPLGACTIAQSKPVDATPAAACRNDALAQFVGQPATQALGARMLTASGARVIRWVPKDSMVTMEFRADRVTAYLDGSNRVERASCG